MNLLYKRLTAIDGITCVKPKGALYMFPKIDLSKFNIKDDEQLVYELLVEQKVLMVPGNGFNYPEKDHFRIVTLPNLDELNEALDRIEEYLESRRKITVSVSEEILQ